MSRGPSMTLGEQRSTGSNLGCAVRGALLLLAFLVVAVLALMLFRAGGEPEVAIEPERPGIGARTPVNVTLQPGSRGVGAVRAELIQGDRVVVLAEREGETSPAWKLWGGDDEEQTFSFDVGRETVEELTQGEATLRVTAERPGAWVRNPDPTVEEVTLPVRLSPPALSVQSDKHYATQGGSEVVVFRVGETAIKSGVQAGEHWFPSYPLPGGDAGADGEADPQARFAFFSVPFDVAESREVQLVAEDDVGNRAAVTFIDRFTPRSPVDDDVQLSESFMQRVVPEIISHTPGFPDQGGLLENYLHINGEMRRDNRKTVGDLAEASKEEFLWTRPFDQMRNAAVMSNFATHRTYYFEDKPVDEAFHLGYDLATVQQDNVLALNSGVVAKAEYLGIYGNVVIIDHGYGLFSLYGHLSSIDVDEGQRVSQGDRLGRTGQTGLAGGDHLHLGIFLHGVAVDPKEWWDDNWLEDRVARKLGDAWPYEG